MAYVNILPKNLTAQTRVTENADAIMDLLFAACKEVLRVADDDIIVELNSCTTIAFHRAAVDAAAAPDVVLTFATSDHHLQPRFRALCDRVVEAWNARFADIAVEVWVSPIDTWGTNIPLEANAS